MKNLPPVGFFSRQSFAQPYPKATCREVRRQANTTAALSQGRGSSCPRNSGDGPQSRRKRPSIASILLDRMLAAQVELDNQQTVGMVRDHPCCDRTSILMLHKQTVPRQPPHVKRDDQQTAGTTASPSPAPQPDAHIDSREQSPLDAKVDHLVSQVHAVQQELDVEVSKAQVIQAQIAGDPTAPDRDRNSRLQQSQLKQQNMRNRLERLTAELAIAESRYVRAVE